MPKFSVIIPTFNRFKQVQDAINSVLAQTMQDFELIVIDDGSTDTTPEIEKKYLHKITYFRQANKGVSAARNQGIALSRSPHITLLDSDDLWHRSKLERHHEYLKAHKDIKVHQTGDTWIRNGKRVNPKKKHLKKEGHIFTESLELCLISPSAVCLDRKLFETYGFFDEDLPACEDYDLWLRVSAQEFIGLDPEPMVTRFGGHEDQLSAKHWGMDRFRIYSIIKLLRDYGKYLKPEYREQAKETALKKLAILKTGAQKRKNYNFEESLDNLIHLLGCDNYKKIDGRILLEK